MIIYFGGLGEHGTDLGKQFRQTKVFEKVADLNFQKRHPCYNTINFTVLLAAIRSRRT
jgi:hypothetical protein